MRTRLVGLAMALVVESAEMATAQVGAALGPKPPGFVFLSDPGHRVTDRYGLLNPEGCGWPGPTTFVIDRQGIVRWKFVEEDYRVRASNEQILEALAGSRR